MRRPSWLGRHPWSATALVVGAALAVGISTGQLLRQRGDDQPAPSTTAVSSRANSVSASQPTASGGGSTSAPPQPWEGPTAVLAATAVEASCTAPPATDTSGQVVTYVAEHLLDDDPSTAWRCNGDGEGVTLSFTFPAGSTLVGVGVVNGYTKTTDGQRLYEQYRRVLSVEWRMPDGTWFSQSLADNTTGVQQVTIPPIPLDGPVVLTVRTSSAPGQPTASTRDAILLSQVQFLTSV